MRRSGYLRPSRTRWVADLSLVIAIVLPITARADSKQKGNPVAAAQAPPAPQPPPANGAAHADAPKKLEVRLALSPAAAKTLSEPRFRRLIEIELQDIGALAQSATGPLGDHVAYLWIDQPTTSKITIEVRAAERPAARRDIAVLGLSGDVAARLSALAAAELLRAQRGPIRAPVQQKPANVAPTPEQIERASRTRPALVLDLAGSAAFLPQAGGGLGGASVEAGFRCFGVSESLFGRFYTGSIRDAGPARWLEAGLALRYHLWLHPRFRLGFGGTMSLASVHLGQVSSIGGVAGERDTWSARAGAAISAEARVAKSLWLSLALEPGAVLRPVHFDVATAGVLRPGVLEGFWMGASFGLSFEIIQQPSR